MALTLEEKERYLLMASYSAREIMELKGVQKSRASKITKICREQFDGFIKYRPNACTAESFWRFEGTTLEREMYLLGIAKGYVKDEKVSN